MLHGVKFRYTSNLNFRGRKNGHFLISRLPNPPYSRDASATDCFVSSVCVTARDTVSQIKCNNIAYTNEKIVPHIYNIFTQACTQFLLLYMMKIYYSVYYLRARGNVIISRKNLALVSVFRFHREHKSNFFPFFFSLF